MHINPWNTERFAQFLCPGLLERCGDFVATLPSAITGEYIPRAESPLYSTARLARNSRHLDEANNRERQCRIELDNWYANNTPSLDSCSRPKYQDIVQLMLPDLNASELVKLWWQWDVSQYGWTKCHWACWDMDHEKLESLLGDLDPRALLWTTEPGGGKWQGEKTAAEIGRERIYAKNLSRKSMAKFIKVVARMERISSSRVRQK